MHKSDGKQKSVFRRCSDAVCRFKRILLLHVYSIKENDLRKKKLKLNHSFGLMLSFFFYLNVFAPKVADED